MSKLYDYQKEYLEGMPKDIIMAADTGLGKGQMSLAHYRKYSEGRPILVIAPASKVRTGDWDREIEMFFSYNGIPDYQVVSYDSFARNPSKFINTDKPEMALILDECHYICNSQAKRSKAVVKLARQYSHQVIGLSATPLPNGWTSMENYAILFGLSKNKTHFLNRFVRIDRSKGFPIVMGFNEKSVMENFWGQVSKPLKREGIADLPASKSIARNIVLSKRDMQEYRWIIKNKVTPDGEMLDNPSKTFAYLRQWTIKHREDELINLLEGTTEHVVVFYNYNEERELIHKVLATNFKERLVFEQSGHASNLPPRNKWDTMKPSVTIAQYQSASTAIELTYASVTIYLSPTYSFAQFHQSMGRTKRNGQKKKTLFYMMAVDNTMDKEVYKVLRTKRDFDANMYQNYLDSIDKLEETE